MKRTVERVLSIISAVLSFLSLIILIMIVYAGQMMMSDPAFEEELMFEIQSNPTLYPAEAEMNTDLMNNMMLVLNSLGWILVIVTVVAIILAIIGAVKVNRNAKTAGILFIVGGILSGIISIPGILLLIAGTMCFVRKEKISDQQIDQNLNNE